MRPGLLPRKRFAKCAQSAISQNGTDLESDPSAMRELGILTTVRLVVRENSVYCPRQRRRVALAECIRCPRCQCVSQGAVICRLPGARSLLR
jgi:hypothetical protein